MGKLAQQAASRHPEWGITNRVTEMWERDGVDRLSGFLNMYHPFVMPVDDPEWPWRMWFFGWAVEICNPGWPGCDATFHARSRDMKSWDVYCGPDAWDPGGRDATRWVPVLTAGSGGPWDTWHNGDTSIVRRDGRYYMAYSATGTDLPNGMPSCVMGAVSDDGINWVRSEQPLAIHPLELEVPQTPAARAALPPGPGVQRCGSYHRPSLLFDEGRWKLWFDYLDVAPTVSPSIVGYAEAAPEDFMKPGGFRLVRVPGENPVKLGFPNPDVIRVGDVYHAFGDPYVDDRGQWDSRQVTHAISDDGLDWTVVGHVEHDPDCAANQVPVAQLLEEGGRRWLAVWYGAQVGGEPYSYYMDRIRMMRIELDHTGLPLGW